MENLLTLGLLRLSSRIMDQNNKNMQKSDPLKRQVSVSAHDMGDGLSPMSPPDAFGPPAQNVKAYDDLHPFLQELTDDHKRLLERIDILKKVLNSKRIQGSIDVADVQEVKKFLIFFNEEFIPHNQKEESQLFKSLHEKLLESGEHSSGTNPFTGIQVLEDDHVQAVKQGAIISHLLKLIDLIKDQQSQAIVYKEIIKLGNELGDLLQLHIFREDNIIFGQAQEFFTTEELDRMKAEFD